MQSKWIAFYCSNVSSMTASVLPDSFSAWSAVGLYEFFFEIEMVVVVVARISLHFQMSPLLIANYLIPLWIFFRESVVLSLSLFNTTTTVHMIYDLATVAFFPGRSSSVWELCVHLLGLIVTVWYVSASAMGIMGPWGRARMQGYPDPKQFLSI